MGGEAQVNKMQNGKKVKPSVVQGVGAIVSDVTSLAELQFDLFKTDCKESKQKLILASAVLGVAALVVVGAVPVILLTIAAAFYEFTELNMTWSLLISIGIGLLFGALMALIGKMAITRAVGYFERTTTELKRNVDWLKTMKQRETSRNRGTGNVSTMNYSTVGTQGNGASR